VRLTAEDIADYRALVGALFPRDRCTSCGHARSWHHAEQWEVAGEGWQVEFRCSGCRIYAPEGSRCPGPFLPVRPDASSRMGVGFIPVVRLRDPPSGGRPMCDNPTSGLGRFQATRPA